MKETKVAKRSSAPSESEMDLLGTVAHDLKTPISSIKSFVDLIRQDGGLTERQERYLGRVDLALQNMTNLVNDLLDLVWLEGGMELKMAPCNLLDVARSQVHALEGYAQEKGVTLQLTNDANLTLVRGDERRLGQVVSNLIGNGIKYNRPGGSIWIHVERLEKALQVTIRDNGIGIAAEDLPHVFDRFFRARHPNASHIEGSGLGLAIVKAIVEQHGGTITISSVPNEGSTVQFTIPV
jgi:signal transduction histidine kinase